MIFLLILACTSCTVMLFLEQPLFRMMKPPFGGFLKCGYPKSSQIRSVSSSLVLKAMALGIHFKNPPKNISHCFGSSLWTGGRCRRVWSGKISEGLADLGKFRLCPHCQESWVYPFFLANKVGILMWQLDKPNFLLVTSPWKEQASQQELSSEYLRLMRSHPGLFPQLNPVKMKWNGTSMNGMVALHKMWFNPFDWCEHDMHLLTHFDCQLTLSIPCFQGWLPCFQG